MSGQLWMLCEEHGEKDAHRYATGDKTLGIPNYAACPGGHPVDGGDKVWWCDEHEASGDGSAWQCLREEPGPCRMVESFLIPLSNSETTK